MQFGARFARTVAQAAASVVLWALFSTGAMAATLNFKFAFTGNMSCYAPFPVSNASIGGSGAGVINQDGSVSADITQNMLMFATTVHFDSKLGSGLSTVPGGTVQVRVVGKQSLRFFWNLPNNTLVVTVAVRGQSCSATFQANLRPGMTQYSFFDGSMFHYCGKPQMTTSSCDVQ